MATDYLTVTPRNRPELVQADHVPKQEISSGSQEIYIDGMPLQIPAGNYRTEVLEDGTVQVIVYQDQNQVNPKSSISQQIKSLTVVPSETEIRNRRCHDIGIQNTTVPHFNTYSFVEEGVQTDFTHDPLDVMETEFVEDEIVEEETISEPQAKPKRGRPPVKAHVIHNLTIGEEKNKAKSFSKGGKILVYHKCIICGKCYKNKANWQAHLKLHAKEEVFMCGYCGQIFQKSTFPSHLKTHKKESSENTAPNVNNEEVNNISKFHSYDSLQTNLKPVIPSKQFNFHKPKPNINMPAKLEIKTNEIDQQKQVLLKSHQVTLPNSQVATVIDLGSLGNLLTSGGSKDQADTMDNEASDHMYIDNELENDEMKTKYIYKCNVCGKEYNNKSNCHRHLKTHTHEKTYKCPSEGCDKTYMHRYELRMHMRVHTGEKPFKCPVCTRGFNEGGNLRRHMKIHAGDDTPYKCGVCFKGFSEMFRLQVHLKVHSGNIICDTCGKKFGKISDLYRHIRIHTGDKPYKCEVCGKAFCQKVNLQTHYRTHSGKSPFKCTLCNFGFSRKAILDNHMKGHEPEEIEEHEFNLRMLEDGVLIKQEPQTPAPPPMEEVEEEERIPVEEVVTLDAKTGLVEVTLENQENETGLSQEELAQLVAATVEDNGES